MKKYIRMFILIIFLISPFFLNVFRKNLYLSTSARVINLQNRVMELESEVQELEKEYYRLTSPTRLESLGRRMGLILPDSADIIVLEVEGD